VKRIIKIFLKISTVIGVLILSFIIFGLLYWGIDTDSFRYNRNSLVTSQNLENEGPFIFENDSAFKIKYIQGNSDNGYFLKKQTVRREANNSIKCFYYLDSSEFSFKLNNNLKIEEFEYNLPNKIISISDIESNFKVFRDFLIANKVIDDELNWSFDQGHLVLNGDFIDRSYFTTQVLWLIYKLDQEAIVKGGKVHYILGNHEIMNIQGNHQYSKSKYRNVASILGLKQHQLYDSTTHLGKWLLTKNVAEKIGSYVFTHGGLSPEIADNKIGLKEINEIARKNYQIAYFTKKNRTKTESIILNEKLSPYWYRGYFKDKLKQADIDKILKFYNCSQIIVGHTIQKEVNRKYEGKIIGTDISMPKDYYKYFPKLPTEGLLIENGKFYKIDEKGLQTEI
jgi:hypothetical protein